MSAIQRGSQQGGIRVRRAAVRQECPTYISFFDNATPSAETDRRELASGKHPGGDHLLPIAYRVLLDRINSVPSAKAGVDQNRTLSVAGNTFFVTTLRVRPD